MNNEELDSQLSAMFDDELPEPECELLARRLARDEGLKARWGRYAAISACIRMERGGETATSVGATRASARQTGSPTGELRPARAEARGPRMRLNGDVARRVSRMVAEEPPLLAGSGVRRTVRRLAHPAISRRWQPVAAGAAVATAVAASAILWLRAGSPDAPIVAQAPIEQSPIGAATANRSASPRVAPPLLHGVTPAAGLARAAVHRNAPAPDSFVVPPAGPASSFAPPIELANFVVAHSEYSMPLVRRSALTALVADEPLTDDAADTPLASSGGSSDAAGGASASASSAASAQGHEAANADTSDRSNGSQADSPH